VKPISKVQESVVCAFYILLFTAKVQPVLEKVESVKDRYLEVKRKVAAAAPKGIGVNVLQYQRGSCVSAAQELAQEIVRKEKERAAREEQERFTREAQLKEATEQLRRRDSEIEALLAKERIEREERERIVCEEFERRAAEMERKAREKEEQEIKDEAKNRKLPGLLTLSYIYGI
jgi:hypothetical protein